MKELETIPKTAEIFKLCPATVRNRIKKGIWPYHAFGKRSIRLDPDEIREITRVAGKSEDEKRAS